MSSQIWRILLLTTCFVPVAVVSAALDDDIRVIINVTGEDPGGLSWADSYSIGDSCYCSFSTFDHGLINFNVETPLGWMTLPELCQKLGPGPGMEGRPIYNDVQCGNGPPNDAGDEHTCPGRVDLGREGCGYIGPKWNFLPLIEQNSSSSPSSSPSSQSMSPSGEPSVAPNIEPTMSSPIDSGSFQEPPILINFGKSTAVNGYGVADQLGYLQGPVNDYGGGGETISMTSSAEAYASHSWSFEYLSYTITLDAQETYRVTLGFAESYTPNCEIGRRVFDVAVGSHTRNGVDVFEAAGCLTAYNVVFPEVQPLPSGTITINVTKTDRNNPFIATLAIERLGGFSPSEGFPSASPSLSPSSSQEPTSAPPLSDEEPSSNLLPVVRVQFGSLDPIETYDFPNPAAIIAHDSVFMSDGGGITIEGTSMTIESEAYASHVWSFSYVAYDMTLEPSASYDVRLGFAETYLPNCAEGSRLFNIQVGLEAILEDVDVWKEAGCFAAHDIVFTNVIASDTGLLTVNVTKGREQNPFLSLIEVTPSVSTTDHSDANSISPSQFPAISPSTVGGVYDNLLTRVNFGSSSSIEGYDNPESSKLTGLPGINSFGGAGTVISGATVNDVYASHVWAWEELRYSLDVDATRQYDVKVMVAESYTPNCYVGQRVFHLAVGDQRKDDIDVFDQAGCATALNIEFSNVIPDSEGKLEIAALKKPDADNPFISAVEVSYSSGSAPGQIASTFLPSAAPLSGAESASVAPSGHVSLAPSQIESLPPSTIESVSPSSVDSLEPSEALPPTSFPTYVPTLYPSALPTPPAAANEPIIKVHFGRRQRAADGYDFPQPTNLNGTINWFAGYGIPIAGTNAVGAYASHVWSDTYAGYKMVLDSSKLYTVRVGFAESYEPNCVVGKRIFNLQVGSQLVSDIDVFREAGCKTAYNVTLNNVVPLSSGVLEVVVTKGDADNAFMSLLEVMLAS